jgi:hypothetical protein
MSRISNRNCCAAGLPSRNPRFIDCERRGGLRGEGGFLLLQTCHLHYCASGMFPVNIGFSRKDIPATIVSLVVRLSLVGMLFAAGCTTVHTERASLDQSLRSRTARGPSSEIFILAARCIRREFPDGVIRSDATAGEIVVTNYSVMRGDAELKVTVIGSPDDRVEVNASAIGLGANQQRKVVDKFLGDFDQAYADWAKEQRTNRRAVE